MATQLNITLDDLFKMTPYGSRDRAIGGTFFGFNHLQQPNAVPINRDSYGLTFFVRPQLNLSKANLRAERQFIPLLTDEPASIQRIIRCYLDPRLSYLDPNINCPFVDQQNPFIPILSNHIITCTGWPDPVVESFTSKPGAYKEVYGFVDGVIDKYSSYSLTCTFRNMEGSPIVKLFNTWLIYSANVFAGTMSPYPDFIVQNEIDYNTRIYRLVLDKNKRYVKHIACTGAAEIQSVPLGSVMFNYDTNEPYNLGNKDLTFQFKCYGYCYDDDIIIHEFNKTVSIFNPSMDNEHIQTSMAKIPYEALGIFKNSGYPRINPRTYELEWYINKTEYNRVIGAYERSLNAIGLTSDIAADGGTSTSDIVNTNKFTGAGSAPANNTPASSSSRGGGFGSLFGQTSIGKMFDEAANFLDDLF